MVVRMDSNNPLCHAEEVMSYRDNCAGRTIEHIGSWMNPICDP